MVQIWPDGAIVTVEGDAGPAPVGSLAVIVNGPYLPNAVGHLQRHADLRLRRPLNRLERAGRAALVRSAVAELAHERVEHLASMGRR